MDFESWWLIFVPVLFGLGWLAARVDIRQMLSENRVLPNSYFQGLNFLLNEQPDRAIDAFIEVAKLDTETLELHFALGSLFRRRGEMERAIRVHQSLLTRSDLPALEREQAQYELALDFLKAGMLDHAESGFKQLKSSSRYALPALNSLIRIYESEHDWTRAIEAVQARRTLVNKPVPQLVHYHCEQAQAAFSISLETVKVALDAADDVLNSLDPNALVNKGASVRIALLRARLAQVQGQSELECDYLKDLFVKAPEYAALAVKPLLENFRLSGQAKIGLAFIRQHYERFPSLDLFNETFRELRSQEGAKQAWAFARHTLEHRPSLLALDQMLEIELATPLNESESSPILNADMSLLRTLIHKHTQRLERYSCRTCGFQARSFYWQCPACNVWETYVPRRLEEF